jgi:hypothetical protein
LLPSSRRNIGQLGLYLPARRVGYHRQTECGDIPKCGRDDALPTRPIVFRTHVDIHTHARAKAPFRACIGHVRYCSHCYRIAALREYIRDKLTTRQGWGDDNGISRRGHPGHDAATRPCHSSLKSFGTSPNFFSTTASENSPTFGSPARLNATAPHWQDRVTFLQPA